MSQAVLYKWEEPERHVVSYLKQKRTFHAIERNVSQNVLKYRQYKCERINWHFFISLVSCFLNKRPKLI